MRKIYIVEDDAFLRSMLGTWLSSRYPGFEVACFSSAEEALAAFAVPPALLIMDIRLPGMSGIAAAKSLRNLPGKPPVILISVWSEEEYVRDAEEAGVDAFVPKQSLWRQLLPLADGLLATGSVKTGVKS
jgi:CheY-like chemotaxis protein